MAWDDLKLARREYDAPSGDGRGRWGGRPPVLSLHMRRRRRNRPVGGHSNVIADVVFDIPHRPRRSPMLFPGTVGWGGAAGRARRCRGGRGSGWWWRSARVSRRAASRSSARWSRCPCSREAALERRDGGRPAESLLVRGLDPSPCCRPRRRARSRARRSGALGARRPGHRAGGALDGRQRHEDGSSALCGRAGAALVIAPDREGPRAGPSDSTPPGSTAAVTRPIAAGWSRRPRAQPCVVGTRSALLVPLPPPATLALIDEHDPAHKPPGARAAAFARPAAAAGRARRQPPSHALRHALGGELVARTPGPDPPAGSRARDLAPGADRGHPRHPPQSSARPCH